MTASSGSGSRLGARADDDVVVGFIGRLVREKGVLELVDAATSIMAELPQARFALIGPHDPSRRDDVPAEVLDQARANGIAVLGSRSDVVELYAAMDVFVLPSHREGFPRSVMEAAAMGIPTVASDIRGCREAVMHEHSGLLVPRGDTEALRRALHRLIADRTERDRLGAGQQRWRPSGSTTGSRCNARWRRTTASRAPSPDARTVFLPGRRRPDPGWSPCHQVRGRKDGRRSTRARPPDRHRCAA